MEEQNVELLGDAGGDPISGDNANVESQPGATQEDQGSDSYIPEIEIPESDTNTEGESQQASSEDKEKSAKDDPTRFQYWQSQADQYKRQLELEREQSQALGTYAPIAKYLQENPQLLDVLERELQGGHPQPQAPVPGQQVQQRTSLERPEKPLKPNNYDPNETDPESPSYKYRQALANYNDDLIEYMVARDEYREQQMQEQRRMAEQEAQKQGQVKQLSQQLQVEYGLNDFEAQDFMRTMMDPSSVTLDNLVDLYRVKKGGRGQQTAQVQQKAQDILNRQGKKVPPPAGISGANAPQFSDEDVFNASLHHFGNR
jgi:hypothetical protein